MLDSSSPTLDGSGHVEHQISEGIDTPNVIRFWVKNMVSKHCVCSWSNVEISLFLGSVPDPIQTAVNCNILMPVLNPLSETSDFT